MKPAPPVTSTRRVMGVPIVVGSTLRASCTGFLAGGAGVVVITRRGAIRWLVEREEEACRVDDFRSVLAGRRRAQSDGGSMQELVHERPREMLHGLPIVRREVAEAPEGDGELALSHTLHLGAECREHRNRREPAEPGPIALDLLAEQRLGGRQLVLSAADRRRDDAAQVV